MNNTQEKAATDNNGSYDQENPDIRYSLSDYSEADRFDLIKAIKPYVGRSMNKSDADYLKFFKDKNLPVYTEADAHEIAATAMYENRSDRRRAAAQKRDKWLYDNLPLYAAAAIQENRDGLIRDLPLQLCRLLYHTASTAPPEHVLQCILQRCEYQSKALVPPFVSTFLPIPETGLL